MAVFEAMVTEDPSKPPRETWVEQVEFHMPEEKQPVPPRSASLKRNKVPSLAQITAHYTPPGAAVNTLQPAPGGRLPQFLARGAPAKTRNLPADVGRLHFPTRSNSPPAPEQPKMEIHAPVARPPMSPCSPKLQITTTVVRRSSSHSPTEFTETNLRAFDAMRAGTAQAMLTRLRRRTMPVGAMMASPADLKRVEEEKKMRRRSAPPEMTLRERRGFTKPPLNLPGAF